MPISFTNTNISPKLKPDVHLVYLKIIFTTTKLINKTVEENRRGVTYKIRQENKINRCTINLYRFFWRWTEM